VYHFSTFLALEFYDSPNYSLFTLEKMMRFCTYFRR